MYADMNDQVCRPMTHRVYVGILTNIYMPNINNQ